jgi:uncharacterized protein
MIIDGDCHISPPTQGGNSITAEGLIRRMDDSGVDKALCWLQPPYRRETDEANLNVYESMRRYPDRIVGFGWADPNLGVNQAKDTVKRCIHDYGLYGVKLNGAQNNYYIDDEALSLPVIEEIARTGKLLAFHVGGDAPDQTHPFRVRKIATRYPKMGILMVHMGGVTTPDTVQAAIEVAAECPSITLIASAVRGPKVLKAIDVLGAERVCYGSDTPFEVMRAEVARFQALLRDVTTEAEQALVMGGSLARVLGIA